MKFKEYTFNAVKTAVRCISIPFGYQTYVKRSFAMWLTPFFVATAGAQTLIPSGTSMTTSTMVDGEALQVAAGSLVNVAGAPAIVLANPNSSLLNAGVIATAGNTSTVRSEADDTVITNAAGAQILADSRAVDIAAGNGAVVLNQGAILGTGNQRNGTLYTDDSVGSFTLDNSGVIDAGAGNQGAGFSAELPSSGAEYTLNNSGTIAGRGNAGAGLPTAGDGIRFERNRNAGALDGTSTGELSGTITNSGDITSEAANGTAAGIRFVNGVSFDGTINNEAGGTISGVQNGLYFGNATPAGGGDFTGAVVNNAGLISSGSRALNIDGTGIEINNSGTILATGNQRNGTVYADSTAQDFVLNNSGTIDAGAGLEGAGFSVELDEVGNDFDINNSGTIAGRGNAAAGATAAGDGLRFERTRNAGALDGTSSGLFTGNITNSGVISSEAANGTAAGIRFVNGVSFSGTIENQAGGTISGVQNGLYFGNATPAGGGDFTGAVVNNAGVISSGSRALNIDGTGLEINNSGTILGTGNQRNGTVYADSTAQNFVLNNSGTIDAGAGLEGAGFSVELDEAGNDFDINNSGTIAGRGNAGAGLAAAGDGLRFERTRNAGALDGTSSGLFTGDITNSGVISSEAANGTAAGIRFVNGVSFSGTIDNQAGGTISGVQNGLYFGNATPAGGGDFTGAVVNNAGVISSDSRALNIDGTGLEINNSGTILATGNQRNGTVYADSTAQDFTLNNSGTIDAGAGLEGAGFSVELDEAGNDFDINNSGTIAGRGNAGAGLAAAGDGLRFERSRNAGALDGTSSGLFTGDITNSGVISSEAANETAAGIRFVNGVSFSGTIDNSGTISGEQNGLYFGNPTPAGGGDFTGAVVNNSGIISSGSRALNIDGNGLTVNNSGSILGSGNQRNGTVYFDGTATNATFNNSGLVDAGLGNQGSAVSIQVDAGVRGHTIDNSGTLQGRGAALPSGDASGLRIFGAMAAGTLVDADITNSGTIASETGAGVLIENVTTTGDIVNTGSISGATAAIDTRTALGNVTIEQQAGSLTGGVFTGAGDDVLNISGTSTVTGDIDLGAGINSVNIASDAIATLETAALNGDLDVDGQLGLVAGAPLAVSGAADLAAGSALNLRVDDVTAVDLVAPTTVITATGGVTQGAGVTLSDDSLLTDFVAAAPTTNAVQAQAQLADLGGLQDGNVASLAGAIQQGFVANNASPEFASVANSLDGLADLSAFESAAAGFLPDLNPGVTRELYEAQSTVFNSIEDRLASGANGGAWFQIGGRSASFDAGSSASALGYDADSFSAIVGFDRAISSDITAGIAVSYSDISLDSGSSDTDIEAYSFNIYAAYQRDNKFLRGAIAYSAGDADASRITSVGTIDSDYDLDQFSAKIAAGFDHQVSAGTLSPFVSLQYSNISQDGYDETGGLGLSVDADDVSVLELGVGVGFTTDFQVAGKKAQFTSQLGYYYDLLDEERSLSANFAGGNAFDLESDSISSGTLEIGVGVGVELNESTRLSVGYEGDFGSDFDSHTGYVRMGISF